LRREEREIIYYQ